MIGWWRTCLIVIIVLGGCARVNPHSGTNSVVVSNLKVGAVCSPESDREICENTNHVTIIGDKLCIYDGESVPCTWYGFSFDYSSTADAAKLNCFWNSNEASDVGNPNEVLGRNISQGEYEIDLNGKSGHFFNPQYSVFVNAHKDVRIDTYCAHEGKKVFEFFFVLHYVGNAKAG